MSLTKKAKPERGRRTSQRKAEIVLRLLRGEDLDALSRELEVALRRMRSPIPDNT